MVYPSSPSLVLLAPSGMWEIIATVTVAHAVLSMVSSSASSSQVPLGLSQSHLFLSNHGARLLCTTGLSMVGRAPTRNQRVGVLKTLQAYLTRKHNRACKFHVDHTIYGPRVVDILLAPTFNSSSCDSHLSTMESLLLDTCRRCCTDATHNLHGKQRPSIFSELKAGMSNSI